MIGIYKITNKVNGKVYIGQSTNIQERWNRHKKNMKNGTNKLYQAMRFYGIENFIFTIIEECSKEQLNEREIYWILQYNSYKEGYNSTLGGSYSEQQKKLSEQDANRIKQLLLNTEISQEEIAIQYNIDQSLISRINTGRDWYDDNCTYPLRPFLKKEYFCINCGKAISKKATRCIKCDNEYRRQQAEIYRNTIKGISRGKLKQLIRTTPFTTIAKQYGVSDNAIRKWCDTYNLPRTKKEINSYSDEEWELI